MPQCLSIWRYLLDPTHWDCNGYPTCSCLCNTLLGIHELNFLPQFTPSLVLYHCYINDVFRVWCHHLDPNNDNITWKCFQSTMNSYGFSTALYEKPLNLYQYLPPHSSHVPGITKGFITGLIHQTL